MFRFSTPTCTRLVAASIAVFATGAAMAREPSAAADPTRAEVVADFVLWQRAGLAELDAWRFPITDSEYQRRLALYRQLRQGPEFAAEVTRRGGSPATAAPTIGTQAK